MIVGALKEGVPRRLLDADKNIPFAAVIGQLSDCLANDIALSQDAARWATESWALALGLALPPQPSDDRNKRGAGGAPGKATTADMAADASHEEAALEYEAAMAKAWGDLEAILPDTTPLTLGLETSTGVVMQLIPRGTPIPTSKMLVLSTTADSQACIEIHITQGERAMAADNPTLGRFTVDGIMPAPRGVPQIEVTFDIDANGILNVAARDKGTAKELKVTITASRGLSQNEIDETRREAEQHAAEDAKMRHAAEVQAGRTSFDVVSS